MLTLELPKVSKGFIADPTESVASPDITEDEFNLYEFQLHDIAKLVKNNYAAIASEMGTGKTHVAIALWEFWADKDLPSLVCAPLNTHRSWHDKFAQQSPNTRVMMVDRQDRDEIIMSILRHEYDVYIIHWQIVQKLVKHLAKFRFSVIIGDEIHRISNKEAKTTTAFKTLNSDYRVALSGTLTGDKPDQMWSSLNWLAPDIFRSYWGFRRNYLIESVGDSGYSSVIGLKNLGYLHETLEPFFVRHLKREKCCEDHPNGVMPWLKDKTYDTIEVELNATQRRIYDQMDQAMIAWLGAMGDTPLTAAVVIAKLNRLNSIALATPRIDYTTVKRKNPFYELWHQMKDEYADKGIDINTVMNNGSLMTKPNEYLFDEETIVNLELPSSKIDALYDLVTDNPEKQFVVFSSSKKALKLAVDLFNERGIKSCLFSGDTPQNKRDEMKHEFQQKRIRVFFGVIAAVGEGVDGLQHTCDTMVFLDRSWSAKDNKQAEDRLHRDGQKNSVNIIDIVATNTRDQGRHTRLELKWSWIRQMLGDGLYT